MTQNQNVAENNDIRSEIAFTDTGSRQQHMISDALPERVASYLLHCITRNPKNLLAHVQRINAVSARGSQSDIYSALLDLFVALGSQGLSLRRVMLAQVSSQLEPAQLIFLSTAIKVGVGARDVIIDPGASMLINGYSGCDELVTVHRHQGGEKGDPLQQAMASIEFSDLEEARIILEDALYSDRADLNQQKLLLEIYRKTADKKHFMALYETFEAGSNPAHADWQALAAHFELT